MSRTVSVAALYLGAWHSSRLTPLLCAWTSSSRATSDTERPASSTRRPHSRREPISLWNKSQQTKCYTYFY